MEDQGASKRLRFRFQCVMLTVDGRPWIQGGDVLQRIASAAERAVSNRGGRLDSLDIQPDCIVFSYSSNGLEKPTSYIRAIRDAVTEEFGEEGPGTLGRAQLTRGYFSRSDYAVTTLGQEFEKGFASEYAKSLRERSTSREREKRHAKEARARQRVKDGMA